MTGMNQGPQPATTAPERASPIPKALAHALIITAILNALGGFATNAGLALLLGIIKPGAYLPFALSTSAAMHGLRSASIILLAGTIILAYPSSINELATILVPIGAGLLTGTLLRSAISETNGGLS